jgi:hypothetical protein
LSDAGAAEQLYLESMCWSTAPPGNNRKNLPLRRAFLWMAGGFIYQGRVPSSSFVRGSSAFAEDGLNKRGVFLKQTAALLNFSLNYAIFLVSFNTFAECWAVLVIETCRNREWLLLFPHQPTGSEIYPGNTFSLTLNFLSVNYSLYS